jgi:hypothetical protein
MVEEFGLVMERHEGPWEPVESFLTKALRLALPPTPPLHENVPWSKRQAARIREIAPVILSFDALARELEGDDRSWVFAAFRGKARSELGWPSVGGW